MANIIQEQVLFTIPDPRSLGVLTDKLVIREIVVATLSITSAGLNNALTQVMVRDPLTGSIHYNDSLIANAITAVGPVGSAPNANGMTLAAGTLNLEPASATDPGVLTVGAQVIAGGKTFSALTAFTTGLTAASITATTGDITTGSFSIINLPTSTTTAGQVRFNGVTFMHSRSNATCVGLSAGNLTMTGAGNTVIGLQAGTNLTNGAGNTLVGQSAGQAITVGVRNTLVGQSAGFALSSGTDNTIFGHLSGVTLSGGINNAMFGQGAGGATTGSNNCMFGRNAGSTITSGANNIIIGSSAGSAITTTSNNIMLGNVGVGGDSNTIRMGSTQTATYIAGITGYVSAAPAGVITIDANSRLGVGTFLFNQAYTSSIITLLSAGVPSGSVITAMTLRGVNNPTDVYPITYSRIGSLVFLVLPAFQVTANTGGNQTEVRLASGIPVALRPTVWDMQFAISVQDSNNQEDNVYRIRISTGGTLVAEAPNGSDFTTNWGFPSDMTITYTLL